MTGAANLQRGLTTKQLALVFNVSERSIYMARELGATGRADLEERVMAGELSILGALKLAKPEKYDRKPDRMATLVKAWNACTDDQRNMFAARIVEMLDGGAA